MALKKEDVKEIVDAVMATDVMQFCKGLMAEGAAGGPSVPIPATSKLTANRPDSPIVPKRRTMPTDKQIADETVALTQYSRSVDDPVDFASARYSVRTHYEFGTPLHKYHRPRDRKLYDLEASTAELGAQIGNLQQSYAADRGKRNAERVTRYAQERGLDYDTARRALEITDA